MSRASLTDRVSYSQMFQRVAQRIAAIVFALTASVAIVAAAQRSVPAAETIDVQTLGPQIGAAVPDFSLPDQTGQPRTLRSVTGPNGVVLVFFRSADW